MIDDSQWHDLDKRISVLEEALRWKEKLHATERDSNKEITEDRRADVARRLEGLNGEAGRLKTILDNSVPMATFTAYQSSQRDKEDAREKATRERSDAEANEIAKKFSSINLRIAAAVGGASVFLAMLQLYLTYRK